MTPTDQPYWFESETPTFLLDELLKRQVVSLNLSSMLSSSSMLSGFDDAGGECIAAD